MLKSENIPDVLFALPDANNFERPDRQFSVESNLDHVDEELFEPKAKSENDEDLTDCDDVVYRRQTSLSARDRSTSMPDIMWKIKKQHKGLSQSASNSNQSSLRKKWRQSDHQLPVGSGAELPARATTWYTNGSAPSLLFPDNPEDIRKPRSSTFSAGSTTPSKAQSTPVLTDKKNEKLNVLKILSASMLKISPNKTSESEERKELAIVTSNSRNKKFHRLFKQLPPEERVLNYFACALVRDILLQGNLYITDNYFGFYSNVFGHITKLLIPITSVTSVSKEKTAKIIPNAVGIVTDEKKHVFGSLLSRESTYRLMHRVWTKATSSLRSSPEHFSVHDEDDDQKIKHRTSSDSTIDSVERYPTPPPSPTPSKGLSNSMTSPTPTPSPQKRHIFFKTADMTAKSPFAYRVMQLLVSNAKDVMSAMRRLQRSTLFLLVPTILLICLLVASWTLMVRLSSLQDRLRSSEYCSLGPDYRSQVYLDTLKKQYMLQSSLVVDVQQSLGEHLDHISQVRKSLEMLMLRVSPYSPPNPSFDHVICPDPAKC